MFAWADVTLGVNYPFWNTRISFNNVVTNKCSDGRLQREREMVGTHWESVSCVYAIVGTKRDSKVI